MTNRKKVRRWLLWPLLVLAVLFVSIVGFALYWNFGTHFHPPPIAAGICRDWSKCEDPGAAFDAILRHRFPPGTPESLLRSTLMAQGFANFDNPDVSTCQQKDRAPSSLGTVLDCPDWDPHWDPHNRLTFGWGDMACSDVLTVQWSADAAKNITHIAGGHYYVCL